MRWLPVIVLLRLRLKLSYFWLCSLIFRYLFVLFRNELCLTFFFDICFLIVAYSDTLSGWYLHTLSKSPITLWDRIDLLFDDLVIQLSVLPETWGLCLFVVGWFSLSETKCLSFLIHSLRLILNDFDLSDWACSLHIYRNLFSLNHLIAPWLRIKSGFITKLLCLCILSFLDRVN